MMYVEKIILEFNQVFPDDSPEEIQNYLNGISRSTLLNVGAFFLGFKNKRSQFNNVLSFLEMFFREENNEFANEVYKRILKFKEERISEYNIDVDPVISTAESSLNLFEYAFKNSSEEQTQSEAETERNIFKAYLIFNQINRSKESLASSSTENFPIDLRLPAIRFSQQYPFSDLVNFDLAQAFTCQLIKAIYFFEFFSSDKKTGELYNAFIKYFECNDWKDYLKKYVPLAISVIQTEREAHIDIRVPKDESYEENCRFLNKIIVQDNEEITDYDFIIIRGKPIYKVSEGVYRIIFPLFVVEQVFKGLYFKLNELNKTLPNKITNLKSLYSDEFSEKVLVYKILNRFFNNRYIEYSGEEIKAMGIVAEPDYYIRKSNKVFLFESKDILINAKIKQSFDYSQYEGEFKKKLYYEEKNNKKVNKAILQLLNNIRRILRKEFPFDTSYKENNIVIYPILILHDYQFNVPGLNSIINIWFQEELKNLKNEGFSIDKVKPIVIIDIDTFISYQDAFRDRTITLEDALEMYYKFITLDKKKKYKSQEHLRERIQQTLTSFPHFLKNIIENYTTRKIPTILKEKGFSIFNEEGL